MSLKENEIIANVEQYILNAKIILAGGDNTLSEKEEIELFTLQATLEGILNLYRQKEKELFLCKNRMRTSICPICGKEFIHKRSDAKGCPDCVKKESYKNYVKSLPEDKLEERRRRSREWMREHRKKLKERKEENESC